MSFGVAVQTAIYARLAGYSPLMAVVKKVYDLPPQQRDPGDSSIFPYVTIGEDIVTAWPMDDSVGGSISIVINTWSRERGKKQCKTIQGLLFDALSRYELTVSGYTAVTVEYEGEQSFIDVDGLTMHGVSTFRLIVNPA